MIFSGVICITYEQVLFVSSKVGRQRNLKKFFSRNSEMYWNCDNLSNHRKFWHPLWTSQFEKFKKFIKKDILLLLNYVVQQSGSFNFSQFYLSFQLAGPIKGKTNNFSSTNCVKYLSFSPACLYNSLFFTFLHFRSCTHSAMNFNLKINDSGLMLPNELFLMRSYSLWCSSLVLLYNINFLSCCCYCCCFSIIFSRLHLPEAKEQLHYKLFEISSLCSFSHPAFDNLCRPFSLNDVNNRQYIVGELLNDFI
jgi:hypothetical protein